jgi:hypothetical protein
MRRGHEARLGRLVRRVGEGGRADIERRDRLIALTVIGAAIRRGLAQSGIDPARAPALRIADEAAAELAASGDPPPACAGQPAGGRMLPSDAEPADETAPGFDSRIERLVAPYRDGLPANPDFARASLAELYAWGVAADQAGSGGRESSDP